MKGDFTRRTFKREKHYIGVLKQQGRVDLDEDWNEYVEIQDYLRRSTTRDILGRSAASGTCGGFTISMAEGDPGNFVISPGHIYVDGILCENDQGEAHVVSLPSQSSARIADADELEADFEAGKWVEVFINNVSQQLRIDSVENGIINFSPPVSGELWNKYQHGDPISMRLITTYLSQPYYPGVAPLDLMRRHLIYLDVWHRHITAVEDADISEPALGGLDTATRVKAIWQVKSLKMAMEDHTIPCSASPVRPRSARMAAWTTKPSSWDDKCTISPGAGYRGLENHLYRVEIHDDGSVAYDPSDDVPLRMDNGKFEVLEAPGSHRWRIGQAVQIVDSGAYKLLTRVIDLSTNESGHVLLTLNDKVDNAENLKVRQVATFKWSRDNGSVLRQVESILDDGNARQINIKTTERDIPSAFAPGLWAEVTDERCDLMEEPGVLVRLSQPMQDNILEYDSTIGLKKNEKLSEHFKDAVGLKVRLWDRVAIDTGTDAVTVTGDNCVLEEGICVGFTRGDRYRSGDYWLIPARSNTGSIEWPSRDAKPLFVQRLPGEHHYCVLAVVEPMEENGKRAVENCHRQFMPAADLVTLSYVGGDGQEGVWDKWLELPIRVSVFKGGLPCKGMEVKFKAEGNGRLWPFNSATPRPQDSDQGQGEIRLQTDASGMAACYWKLGHDMQKSSQEVEVTLGSVRLCDDNGNLLTQNGISACPMLRFYGTLLPYSFYYISGDGQEAMPGHHLPRPLLVGVSRGKYVADGSSVQFEVKSTHGNGSLIPMNPPNDVLQPDGSVIARTVGGVAGCYWRPNSQGWDDKNALTEIEYQYVSATLLDPIPGGFAVLPLYFNCNLSAAGEVAYSPKECSYLAQYFETNKAEPTVQGAIDALCARQSRSACTVLGPDSEGTTLKKAILEMLEKGQNDICICLLPGEHHVDEALSVTGKGAVVRITGCGPGSRIIVGENASMSFEGIRALTIKDVSLECRSAETLVMIKDYESAEISSCYIYGEIKGSGLISIDGGRKAVVRNNSISAFKQIVTDIVRLTLDMNAGHSVIVAGKARELLSTLSDAFNADDEETFEKKSAELPGIIKEMEPEAVASASEALSAYVDDTLNGLGKEEIKDSEDAVKAIRALAAGMKSKRMTAKSLQNLLAGVRKAQKVPLGKISQSVPAIAIILARGSVDTAIEDNVISGFISLYGEGDADDFALSEADYKRLLDLLHDKPLPFAHSEGYLHVIGNRLKGILVNTRAAEFLKKFESNHETMDESTKLYRGCIITDNFIGESRSQVLGTEVHMSSNVFLGRGEVAIIVAETAIYSGNSSPDSNASLVSCSDHNRTKEAINLLRII